MDAEDGDRRGTENLFFPTSCGVLHQAESANSAKPQTPLVKRLYHRRLPHVETNGGYPTYKYSPESGISVYSRCVENFEALELAPGARCGFNKSAWWKASKKSKGFPLRATNLARHAFASAKAMPYSAQSETATTTEAFSLRVTAENNNSVKTPSKRCI
jgi:hypothetical protein